MPLDETTTSNDDAPAPHLADIWSSIGPGGHRSAADDGGPPTIRPDDHTVRSERARPARPPSSPDEKVDPHVTESTNPRTPATSTSDSEISSGLRDELRIGVRMIKALDAQLKQAEASIRRHEEATRRAEEVRVDPAEVERTTNESLRRITELAERIIVDLEGRVARQAEMDTRLDELDAALATVERRMDRMEVDPRPATTALDDVRSGSLAVDDQNTPGAGTTPTPGSTAALVNRAEELRRELRTDLEAICAASATLAEIVDRATQTESILRRTLETTETDRRPSGADDGRIATVLRRLADEIDRTPGSQTEDRPASRRVAGIDLARPVVLDLGNGEESPEDSIESPASSTPTGP